MRKQLLILSLISMLFAFAYEAHTHEGHDHAAPPGSEEARSVETTVVLSDTAINNLGIQTAKAVMSPRAVSVDVNGIVEFLPEKQAIVAARASGRVSEIHVKIGEKVSKGQNLLSILPNVFGSIPFTMAAPIDGAITKQNIVIGQSVTQETVLMEMGDPDQVLVRGVLYETPEVSQIKVGQKVSVTSELLGGEPLTGTVQRMDGAFDRGTRTFNVYALLDNPQKKLLANMQVRLSIETTSPADVLTIPVKAILGDSGESFVFVRNGNEFERRSVKLGAKFGTDREIIEGVFPDEDVVIIGNYQLQFAKSSKPRTLTPEHKK